MFTSANISEELIPKLEFFKKFSQANMGETLGLEFTTIKSGKIVATMPVDHRTKQPFGVLHGGASVALAETLASIGGWLLVDIEKFTTVGVEINANHIRPVSKGFVTGTATIIHQGKSTHVWEIKITNEREKLVCISRCTLAVVPIPKNL